tara:strand:- start:156 stop:446 length:291 start_codon:yes stop_codon:yes gene_type:complete
MKVKKVTRKERAYEYRKIKNEGAIYHLIRFQGDINYKLHSWDGPAIQPHDPGCKLKKEYHINGIQYSKDVYDEIIQDQEGLPWYKQTAAKGENNRH